MRGFIAGVVGRVVLWLLKRYRELALDVIKIESAIWYVRGVRTARRAFLGVLALGICLTVGAVALVLIHSGLYALLPWPVNAWTLMGLGVLYLIMVLLILRWVCSERTWMRYSGASEYTARVTRRRDEPD